MFLRLAADNDSEVVTMFELAAASIEVRRQREQEAEQQYIAMHDPLSGLPNRALFLDRLRMTLARLQRRCERRFAVMVLDLDDFKGVKGLVGPAGVEALLLEFARRLRGCVRPQDTVAHFGGDEFALLLDEAGKPEDVASIAERIQRVTHKPVWLEGEAVAVSVSMGIVVVRQGYREACEVLRSADAAMNAAKDNGKSQHAFAPEIEASGATIQPCLASARPRQAA